MNTHTISVPYAGTVIADALRGTLRPRTHVVGQRLAIGYSDCHHRNAVNRRAAAERAATRAAGHEPMDGWVWLDHNGLRA